jgi:hypothetical protein
MIFEVKQDGQCKARLVACGHMVEPRGINSQSLVVKGISIQMLDLIAHCEGLKTLCGYVGNALITADCLEKIYSIAGLEFGEQEDSVMLLAKANYSLRLSSHAFHATFANSMAEQILSYVIQSQCLDATV